MDAIWYIVMILAMLLVLCMALKIILANRLKNIDGFNGIIKSNQGGSGIIVGQLGDDEE
jgi:hypothetical protein